MLLQICLVILILIIQGKEGELRDKKRQSNNNKKKRMRGGEEKNMEIRKELVLFLLKTERQKLRRIKKKMDIRERD